MKLLALRAIRAIARDIHDRIWIESGPCMDPDARTYDAYFADLERRRPGRGQLAKMAWHIFAELEYLLYREGGVKWAANQARERDQAHQS